jgi:Retinal pigment epithelial membrane protein
MAFLHNPDRGAADLVILAAQDFTSQPVARVHLPARIPIGFHGSWITGQQLPNDPQTQMPLSIKEIRAMSTITTKDGTEIHYQDRGEDPVVTFWHGWPLNAGARGRPDAVPGPAGLPGHRYHRRSLRRGVQEHTEAGETGLSDQLPDEDPGADPGRHGARPGRIQ